MWNSSDHDERRDMQADRGPHWAKWQTLLPLVG